MKTKNGREEWKKRMYLGVQVIWLLMLLMMVSMLTLLERKNMGSIQRRRGPNYHGWQGIIQPIMDGLKLILKKVNYPIGVRRGYYNFSSWLVFVLSICMVDIVMDIKGYINIDHIDYIRENNILVWLIYSGLIVYGFVLSGWCSMSNYGLLGSIRGATQVIAYELCIGLFLLILSNLNKTYNIEIIVNNQEIVYNIYILMEVIVIVFIIIMAELNRTPFDLPEAESELVAGYNIEYSGMKFALFFLGEYLNIYTGALLYILFILGGYDYKEDILMENIKIMGIVLMILWMRSIFPRYRFDQVMVLFWNKILPILLYKYMILI